MTEIEVLAAGLCVSLFACLFFIGRWFAKELEIGKSQCWPKLWSFVQEARALPIANRWEKMFLRVGTVGIALVVVVLYVAWCALTAVFYIFLAMILLSFQLASRLTQDKEAGGKPVLPPEPVSQPKLCIGCHTHPLWMSPVADRGYCWACFQDGKVPEWIMDEWYQGELRRERAEKERAAEEERRQREAEARVYEPRTCPRCGGTEFCKGCGTCLGCDIDPVGGYCFNCWD